MSKQNFITVTLLFSALAFNPVFATEINSNVTSSQRQINSISSAIASMLHHKGLDEDAADALSKELIDNDELFEVMLSNLLRYYPNIGHQKILEHLSTAALHRQSIDLASYDQLVNLVSKVDHTIPSEYALKQLHTIAKLNQMVVV